MLKIHRAWQGGEFSMGIVCGSMRTGEGEVEENIYFHLSLFIYPLFNLTVALKTQYMIQM